MNKNVVLALLAGLLGGLFTRYIAPPSAYAQNQAPITRELRAQSFTLVDRANQTAGTFTVEPASSPSRMRIVLRDSSGREIWSAGGPGTQPLSAR
jgi:hypothetical protein